jgi:uncharacterized repeat protein (TIGR04138 family)
MSNPLESIVQLLREDRRYKRDAYAFIFDALGYAQEVLEMGQESPSEPAGGHGAAAAEMAVERHVSGPELCEAIRQLAIQQYGYMAQTVLNSWGLRSTGDIGEIVFNLIRVGQMRKTPNDHREDFDNVYDFDEAFRQRFKIER